jgi:endonuclease YncB( thermonuclease family)
MTGAWQGPFQLWLIAGLLVVWPQIALAEDCPVASVKTARVVDVLDGNTLRLGDGVTARLAGIEAPIPPLSQPANAKWPPAEASRERLRDLVGGQTVGVAPAGSGPDRYSRLHAFVFLADGRSVQSAMVEGGLARVRWLPEESQCFQVLLTAEERARKALRGLWSSPDYRPRSANDPSLLERNGLYELVEGRIVSVGHGTRMVFLDFGRNYRRDFTVMVSPAVVARLNAAGLSPDGFANRRVRVRGVIEESGGPAIRLNDPAEIELLDDDQNDVGAHR